MLVLFIVRVWNCKITNFFYSSKMFFYLQMKINNGLGLYFVCLKQFQQLLL